MVLGAADLRDLRADQRGRLHILGHRIQQDRHGDSSEFRCDHSGDLSGRTDRRHRRAVGIPDRQGVMVTAELQRGSGDHGVCRYGLARGSDVYDHCTRMHIQQHGERCGVHLRRLRTQRSRHGPRLDAIERSDSGNHTWADNTPRRHGRQRQRFSGLRCAGGRRRSLDLRLHDHGDLRRLRC
ncbi:unannotated protein [freshwater metagenome]|uniref:Unannotated protein n=1 Tax=freshwater metagenome TaxID=449393 RepID=A0A6J6WS17_9ZZZZ